MNKLGIYIKHRRNILSMTQGKLAEKMGVSRISVANWEAGRYPPSKEKLPQMARVLNTTLGRIMRLAGIQDETKKRSGQVSVTLIPPEATPPDLHTYAVDSLRFDRSFLPPAPDYMGLVYPDGTTVVFSPSQTPKINQWAVALRNNSLVLARVIAWGKTIVLLDPGGISYPVESDQIIGTGLLQIRRLGEDNTMDVLGGGWFQ